MEQWLFEEGCDGFNIVFPYVPEGLEDFVDKVVPELSDPRRVETVPFHVNDLLRSEPIPLSCGRLIEKPSEETEPSWSRRRHVDGQPQSFSSERSAGATPGCPPDRTFDEAKN
jgi:hypothetical protein